MFDALFELLFEYRPVIFEQGDFRFAPVSGSYAAAIAAMVAVVATVVSYRGVRARGHARDRAILAALRLSALAVMLFCLFRPVLVVKAAVPQQNFLGILLDDSRSMQIADWRGEPRGAFVRQQFGSSEGAPDSTLFNALSDRFALRVFRFSSAVSRLSPDDRLRFDGAQTRLAAALDGARQELAGLPLAGLVLVSDGADTTEASLAQTLLALKAEAVPVFTIGVGRETLTRDIQLGRITTPRAVLKGTSVLIDVVITQTGFRGETVTVDVENEGRIVGSQQVRLPADGEPATVRVRFTASEAGPRVFRFRVPPHAGELVTQNNVRDAFIDVRDRREKLLYFEGEPRFEVKFIRRAVADDKNLQVVVLQRTADNKYLRLDVDNPEELGGGFPKTREELFAYRGLILGSIEAGAFTGDQLRMIAEFVDRRGGGLLMLGGPRAFAEGGYAGTPVGDVLPVVLQRAARAEDAAAVDRLKIRSTRAGDAHAVTQIAQSESGSAARWTEMPEVTSVNSIRAVRPGATVLLSGTNQQRREQVVLAFQRYGRGKALAFPVQDSWIWQMHAKIAVDDLTHENYWRQLLRWLVADVPDRVETHTTTDRVEPGETATLRADVVDSTFIELNDARVVAHVTGPAGAAFDVPLQWSGERSGEYQATFAAATPGLYEAQVEASREGRSLGTAVARVRAGPGDAEYFDATMHAPLLRRIAEDTGGRFYPAENVAGLPEDLRYTGRGVTTVEERELWHMPIVLLLLMALVCAEWGYRRFTNLP